MADYLDEPVTNGATIDASDEQAPDTGTADDTGQLDAGAVIEDVPGFELPGRSETAATMLGADTDAPAGPDMTLADYVHDVGNATYGFGPETVHGIDDRVRITNTDEYPWRVHCSLLIKAADNSNWIGTAWFISPNVLVTAGHCLYIKGSGVSGRDGWVNSIRVIPGRDRFSKPYGEATSTRFYSVRGWTENGDPEYDYGAIVLDTPLGNETGWFGFGVYDDDDLLGATANIAGYPGDKPSGTQWYGARRVDSVGPRKVFYDIDTAGGQSGSAVYRIRNGGRYGIGVHAYGGAVVNSGTRINRAVFDNILAWRDDNSLGDDGG